MRRLAVALAAAASALGACPAAAETGRLADFTLGLSSRAPASAAGFEVHVRFHRAGDPNAKPSPLRTAVLALAPGLRFDTTTLPQCTASDDEIRTLGPDACPHDTELTVGSLAGATGFGPPFDPLVGDDHVFNGPDQFIEVVAFPGSSASPAFDRLKIAGSTLTAHPPMLPGGPPDGETAVRSIDFQVPVRSAGAKALITTPPGCPAGARWTTSGTFGFADGSSDTVVSATPCAAGGGTGLPPVRLTVRPRRVRAGHVVHLRFRVSSTERSCVEGASIRLGGRTVRTDARGRTLVAIEFHHAALRRARTTTARCGPAHARVRIF